MRRYTPRGTALPFAATTEEERRELFIRGSVTGLAHAERASIPAAPWDQRSTPERRDRLLTAGTFRSIGLEAMFTRHAISPIEVVGCATLPPEHEQSDSTNRAFASGELRFGSFGRLRLRSRTGRRLARPFRSCGILECSYLGARPINL